MPPLPPAADESFRKIEEELGHYLGQKIPAPLFCLEGGYGGGKSAILGMLAERFRDKLLPIHITPPELDLDAPPHFVYQAASALRMDGVNGVLEPAFSVGASFPEKTQALLEALTQSQALVLIDLPPSWTRGESSPDVQGTQFTARELMDRVLEHVASVHPTVVVTRERWGWTDKVKSQIQTLPVAESSRGAALLREAQPWGPLSRHAERLAAMLGDIAARVSPLTLRMAVALLALNYSQERVKSACELGFLRTARLLADEVRRRRELARVVARLMLARFPLPPESVHELAKPLPVGSPESDALHHALLLELDGGLSLHPSLKQVLSAGLHAPQANEFLPENERNEVHVFLSRLHARQAGQAPKDRASVLARMEQVYHSAAAGETEVVFDWASDVTQFCALGRALSRRGDYQGAAQVFAHARSLSPDNSYVLEYLAYNRARTGESSMEVEQLYAAALAKEPANPWWNRRLIQYLVRRGKIRAAYERFVAANAAFEEDRNNPAQGGREWLAFNFYAGTARSFLDAGELVYAREVLETVEEPLLSTQHELILLWNALQHREEAERLGGSIFPESIGFATRWTDGPRLVQSPQERDRLSAWYPGRVVEFHPEVVLEFAEPPEADATPELRRATMSQEEFRELSGMDSKSEPMPGQFLEILVLAGDETRLALYPLKPAVTFRPLTFHRHDT